MALKETGGAEQIFGGGPKNPNERKRQRGDSRHQRVDTKGAGSLAIKKPEWTDEVHYIPDSREGWVDSVRVLLDGYFQGSKVPKFNYSQIRPQGAPIHGFGGTSSGAGPLVE